MEKNESPGKLKEENQETMKARCSETIMSPRGRRCGATKFSLVNLFKEHLAMKTILAIDPGKL
jgi:hypothetical protein